MPEFLSTFWWLLVAAPIMLALAGVFSHLADKHESDGLWTTMRLFIFLTCFCLFASFIHMLTNETTTRVKKENAEEAEFQNLLAANAEADNKRKAAERAKAERLLERTYAIDVYWISLAEDEVDGVGVVKYLTDTKTCKANWDRLYSPALSGITCESLPPAKEPA